MGFMKISFMTFACPEASADEAVDLAERLGYHGIEFRCDAAHLHRVEPGMNDRAAGQLRARLEDAGLEACCLATSLQFVDEAVVGEATSRLDLAAAIGAPGLRVFCGPMPEGLTIEEVQDRVGRNLALIADEASALDLELWLETHDTFSPARHAAAAVRRADHRNVGLCYDNMHPYRVGEPLATTRQAIDGRVRHCHFHDALSDPDQVVITPLGEGELPMDEMFLMLKGIGYEGYLSGEWFGHMYGEEPEIALTRFMSDMHTLHRKHGVEVG